MYVSVQRALVTNSGILQDPMFQRHFAANCGYSGHVMVALGGRGGTAPTPS
jgi:hypothetical protein